MPALAVAIYGARAAAPGKPDLPTWVVLAGWIGILALFVICARAEEKRRRAGNRPHTIRDTALLLLAGAAVVGLLLCAILFAVPYRLSRPAVYAIIIGVGGSLTYLFNRGTTPKAQ